jgi:ribonuclease G
VTRTLIWDAGPGEVRAGLIEGDQLAEFRIVRPRRGGQPLLQAGEQYTARIVTRVGGNQALVSLGHGVEAVLQPAPAMAEGARLVVEMVRSPIPERGRLKRAKVRPVPDTAPRAETGWHFSSEPAALFLRRMASQVSAILCSNAGAANAVEQILGASAPSVWIDPAAIADADFDALVEQAITGEFPIPDGLMSIEHTRAMTVIDVDGTAKASELNRAAAHEIPRLLRLFDIGGPIGIDFVSLASRAERLELDAALADAAVNLGPHERTATNGFGFCQLIRPRGGASIPEILCGTTPGRMSRETSAISLLRAAGQSHGNGPRQLLARPAIIDLIRQWPDEVSALQSSLGVAIELVSDPSISGYGHVHVAQS